MTSRSGLIRAPAVAGTFYPSDKMELRNSVRFYLDKALDEMPSTSEYSGKAIIVPHAGYRYSGLTAAAAYNGLKKRAAEIKRVVMLGPCHQIGIEGIAVPKFRAFDTPLGRVPVDHSAVEQACQLTQVLVSDETHKNDHALEVHLPFLQVILREFSIVPLIVGRASPNEVAEVLQTLWGNNETLILISSDLSHYLPYKDARHLDNQTRGAIEALNPDEIGRDRACGHASIKGLLMVAREKKLSALTADIRNSGDTAGTKERVVGYGSWIITHDTIEKRNDRNGHVFEQQTKKLVENNRDILLTMAARSVLDTLSGNGPTKLELNAFPSGLQKPGASFVTLKKNGKLRGCIGSLKSTHPLIKDIVYNAYNAAFHDARFPKLQINELTRSIISIEVSVLSSLVPMNFTDELNLLSQLRPGIDGLVLAEGNCRGVFLPAVWSEIPEKHSFLKSLKRKAGLSQNHWSKDIKAWSFITCSVNTQDLPDHINLWRPN